MPERTVSLDEEAYELLETRRRDGESVSDVVRRLAGERSWLEVAGIWSDETSDLENAIADSRSRSRDRAERVADRFDEG